MTVLKGYFFLVILFLWVEGKWKINSNSYPFATKTHLKMLNAMVKYTKKALEGKNILAELRRALILHQSIFLRRERKIVYLAKYE